MFKNVSDGGEGNDWCLDGRWAVNWRDSEGSEVLEQLFRGDPPGDPANQGP